MPALNAGGVAMRGQATMKTLCSLLATALSLGGSVVVADAGDRYLVEVLLFRHVDGDATAEPLSELRDFDHLFALGEATPPEIPQPTAETGQTFQNLWARLRRVSGYEPLAMASWTQSQIDYQPPVRLHDAEVIAEELRLPGPVFWTDLAGGPLLGEYIHSMYRLDGSVQLRRSRFLHIDLDLEYRVDEPAQPVSVFGEAGIVNVVEQSGDVPAPPFRVHRLRQSRQVKSNEIHYFDTAYLGALVRVTPLPGG